MTIVCINRYGLASEAPTGRLMQELSEDCAAKGADVQQCYGEGMYQSRPTSFWHRLWDDCRFYREVCRRRFDADWIICLTDPPLLPILVSLLGWWYGIKTACWVQDVYPDIAYRAGVIPWIVYWPMERLMRWAWGRITVVVVVGHCMQQVLQEKKIESVYIPNWVDGKKWIASRHPTNGDRIYAGRFSVVHGTPALKRYLQATGVRFLVGLSDVDFVDHASRGGTHVVTLRNDMMGLSVPSKVYTALALDRQVEYVGPRGCEVALLLEEAQRMGLSSREFFDRFCDRPIQTEKWWRLLSSR